jgi:hypothetical protein
LVLAVLTIAMILPERAQAQQTGLFPLAPIRRQRVPCDQEDPIYKEYKIKFFGYHPTCWNRFPDGWGCPSRERPDRAKSFKEIPLGTEAGAEQPTGEAPQGPAERGPALPAIPGAERSPFILDRPDNAPGAAPAAPRGGQAPRPAPPGGDPFDMPDQGAPAARPGGNPPAQPPAPRNNGGPNLSPPADEPAQNPGPRASRGGLGDEPAAEADDAPLLALPNINVPPVDDPTSVFEPKSVVPVPTPGSVAANSAGPGASQPPRRGLLSGLFSSLGLNWTRR